MKAGNKASKKAGVQKARIRGSSEDPWKDVESVDKTWQGKGECICGDSSASSFERVLREMEMMLALKGQGSKQQ